MNYWLKFGLSYRESMGTASFQPERRRKSDDVIPCKKFKEDAADEKSTENQEFALNLAARFLAARAQLIQQQVLLQQHHQQQNSAEIVHFSPSSLTQQNAESQLKLSQLLQFAHLQAYLAAFATSTNSENQSE